MGQIELHRSRASDDATRRDLRRSGKIDSEGLEDWQRIVREELATELVAGEGVAVDESDRSPVLCQNRRECGTRRTGTDDRDVKSGFHGVTGFRGAFPSPGLRPPSPRRAGRGETA